jgi:hypothetical protein
MTLGGKNMAPFNRFWVFSFFCLGKYSSLSK